MDRRPDILEKRSSISKATSSNDKVIGCPANCKTDKKQMTGNNGLRLDRLATIQRRRSELAGVTKPVFLPTRSQTGYSTQTDGSLW